MKRRIDLRIITILFVSVVINYLDRNNISIAGPMIKRDFHLDNIDAGIIFSAFGWTYLLFQIPAGFLIDRINPRIFYTVILFLWSLTTVLQAFAPGFLTLVLLRLCTGMFEAPAFPLNNRIVSLWFSVEKRAKAISSYTSGQFLGLAFLTPLLGLLVSKCGWRGLFLVTGCIGIIWSVIWFFAYRNPSPQIKMVKPIQSNKKIGLDSLKKVLSSRSLWGIYIGQFCIASTIWFFLTWFPTYLIQERHLNILKMGMLGSIPFISAFFGVLISGIWSDRLIKRGASFNIARKAPVIFGLFLSSTIILANFISSDYAIIAIMSIAFFGNGVASISWVLVSSIAPEGEIGLTGSVFNFMGGLAAILVPLIIGFLAKSGSFASSILFIGFLAMIGVLSYLFLITEKESTLKHEVNIINISDEKQLSNKL